MKVALDRPRTLQAYVGARILDCSLTAGTFSLTVNHPDVARLAQQIHRDFQATSRLQRSFPVEIVFEDVGGFRVWRESSEGVEQTDRSCIAHLRARLTRLAAVSHGPGQGSMSTWTLDCEGRVADGADNYRLEVVAARITVDERHRAGWIATMGEGRLALLDRFEQTLPIRDWADEELARWMQRTSAA